MIKFLINILKYSKESHEVNFLTHDGMLDQLGESQILPYLSSLSLNDNKVHIISFEKYKSLKDLNIKLDELNSLEYPGFHYIKIFRISESIYKGI